MLFRSDFNLSEIPKLLSFDVLSDQIIVGPPDEYLVTIEKLKIPLNLLPLYVDEEFIIRFDSLDKQNCPPRLTPGLITSKVFSEVVYSIDDFCTKFNAFLAYWLGEYQYGEISYDGKLLSWGEKESTINKKPYINIWVDNRFARLIHGLPMHDKAVSNNTTYFILKGIKDITHVYKQQDSTTSLFYKMISLRVYSSLPTERYILVDNEKKTMEFSNVLTTIDIASEEIANLENYFYHPYQFREYSLLHSSDLKSIRFNFRVLYTNGKESDIYLAQEAHALLSIKFIKKRY